MVSECSTCTTGSLILKQAFPFHFVIDESSSIVSCGDALSRILSIDTESKESWNEHFIFQHPRNINTIEELVSHHSSIYILESVVNPKLVLRGQLLISNELAQCIFLVAPWVTDLDVLSELGLTLSDFPIHSPMSDFLNLVQAQRASLSDSKMLSNELRNLNRELEQRVVRRTEALELNSEKLREANEKLEHEICERARMEVELRHTNKLEAVGQLAAGIAHEINTPIQYVGNSLQFLKRALSDLELLSANVEKCLNNQNSDSEDWRSEVGGLVDELDLEHIRRRAPKAVDRALDVF